MTRCPAICSGVRFAGSPVSPVAGGAELGLGLVVGGVVAGAVVLGDVVGLGVLGDGEVVGAGVEVPREADVAGFGLPLEHEVASSPAEPSAATARTTGRASAW